MLIGYSAKGGVNVELKVDFDKAGHGSIPARESAITILTKGNFHNLNLRQGCCVIESATKNYR